MICNAEAIEETPEVCGNDIDEDCDGSLDNGFDVGATCTVGQGACEAGTLICNDAGTGTECNVARSIRY